MHPDQGSSPPEAAATGDDFVKGWRDPHEYFHLFRDSLQVHTDSHI